MKGQHAIERAFAPAETAPLTGGRTRRSNRSENSLFEFSPVDSFEVQDHFDRLKVSEWSSGILAVVGFASASILYDVTYPTVNTDDIETLISYLFIVCTASTILLLLSLIWRTYLEFIWERARGVHAPHHTIVTSAKYKMLLLELFVNLMHPVWFLRDAEFKHYNSTVNHSAHYSYNAILTFITLFRVYLPIRCLFIETAYRSSRSQRICAMNGCYATSWFAIKCLMKDRPLLVVNTLMLLSIGMGGFAIRIFERPFASYSGQNFADYGNTMWLAILTMTTVGYGDFFPVTFMGRTCVFIVCIWGVMVVSLMVVTITNLLKLEFGEQNALTLYNRLNFKQELRKHAAKVVACMGRSRLLYKREPDNAKMIKQQMGILRTHLNHFQHLKLQQRTLYGLDTPEDRIERKVNLVTDTTNKLKEYSQQLLARLQEAKAQLEEAR